MSRAALCAAVVAALVALTAGCATAPASAPGAPAWVTGRLTVKIEATATQVAQGANAAFELRGSGDAGELHLNSPLGTRMVSARWTRGSAVLTTSQGERTFAGLDELSRQTLGESLPLSALPDWLAGRPWPLAPYLQEAAGFEQLGWHIDLQRLADGWVEARRHTPPSVSLRARLDTP